MREVAVCEVFKNTRDLIKFLNSERIKKECIVSIISMQDFVFLIYYKTEILKFKLRNMRKK